MISDDQLQAWTALARRDDCFNTFVPSDIRAMLAEIATDPQWILPVGK